MSRSGTIAAIGCAGLLAGCVAAGGALGPADYTALYSRGMVNYAAQTGEMTTVIVGSPYSVAVPPEEIASNMRGPGWLPVRKYTTYPRPDTPSSYRVVLLFNPMRLNAGDDFSCTQPQNEPVGVPNNDGSSKIVAVFCAGDRWASHLEGYLPATPGVHTPQFRDAMYVVLADLLPPRNPKIDVGDSPFLIR